MITGSNRHVCIHRSSASRALDQEEILSFSVEHERRPPGGHFEELWQCSNCSSLHKRADTGSADGLRTFYDPVQLLGMSSMLPRL